MGNQTFCSLLKAEKVWQCHGITKVNNLYLELGLVFKNY